MSGKQDEQIETVLHALQHVEPSEVMQGRILSALQAAKAAQSTPAGRHRRPLLAASFSGAVPWLAAAAILLAVGSTLLLHRHELRGTHPKRMVSTGLGSSTAIFSQEDRSPTSIGQRSTVTFNSTDPERVPHVSQRPGIRLKASAETHVSEARRGAPTDLADDRSFPAPPLPLTEQERLLLLLVRHEPPTQLAQLTPPARDANLHREEDRVTEFFMPAPLIPGQQEPPAYVVQTGQQ